MKHKQKYSVYLIALLN